MINYLLLLSGYLLIFFSLIFLYFRLKKISLTKEDYDYWFQIEKKISFLKSKILKLIKLSGKEISFLWYNFIEKILRRIKIEALKIESWAGEKLKALKEKEGSNNLPE